MISQAVHIKRGWILTLSLLIFFLNSFLPVEGFTITLLLTPAWIYYLHNKGRLQECIIAVLSLLPFVLLHFIRGVDAPHYFSSIFVIISVFIFAQKPTKREMIGIALVVIGVVVLVAIT